MLVQEGHRLELALSLALAAVIVGIGLARRRGSTPPAAERHEVAARL